MAIYDISLPINPNLASWPGDAPFRLSWTTQIVNGASVNLGELAMSIHTGTHVDSPFHFDEAGQGMAGVSLESYVGMARVVDVTGISNIGIEDIEQRLGAEAGELASTPRLLLKTGGWPDYTQFPESVPVIKDGVPEWLHEKGITLLGLDVPSVDSLESKELPIHNALNRLGIAILESLDLRNIAQGVYELIALPLRIDGADGSPVRAILRDTK
jgi:arylformamidase